jgi:DNA-binding XRE family transcriptional regulator
MQLADWMAATGLTDETLAPKVNVTRATISRIRRQKQRPSPELARELIRLSAGQVGLAELYGIGEEAA